MRGIAAVVASLGLAVAGVVAAAQEGAPPPPRAAPQTLSPDDHKVLGVLAWRRAVWRSSRADYDRAITEMQAVQDALGPRTDATTLFILGYSRARAGFVGTAEKPLADARARAPEFPGHDLAEAVRISSAQPGYRRQKGTEEAVRMLDRFLAEIPRYDRDAPFAAELRYLGRLEHGLRQQALGNNDAAIRDLEEALAIARAEGQTPSTELVRVLAQAHRDVQQFAQASDLLKDALRRDPGEPSHYFLLGLLAAQQHQRDVARSWHRQALERQLDYAESHAKLAWLTGEARELDAMRRHLEAFEGYWEHRSKASPGSLVPGTASSTQAGYGQYWEYRAEQLAESGDAAGAVRALERARDAYLKAVELQPDCVRAVAQLVTVLHRLGAPAEEVAEWTRRAEELKQREKDGRVYHDTFC